MRKLICALVLGTMFLLVAGCNDNTKETTQEQDHTFYTENDIENNTENNTKINTDNNIENDTEIYTESANWEDEFYILEFDENSEIFSRIKGKSYKKDCTVPVSDLRYLHLLHKNLPGETCEGEIICNKYIAEDLLEIFKELYLKDYPIEKIKLVDNYDADDETSMEDNNSSCFNFRSISHTTTISKHGLGLAVDINPLYNPYIKAVDGKTIIEPVTAEKYTDRSLDFDYKIDENDLAYQLFTEHGFKWGGSWQNPKDYQHFEIPNDVVKELYPDNE